MHKTLVAVAAAFMLFSPVLSAEMPMGIGTGMPGQGSGPDGRPFSGVQQKPQAVSVPAPAVTDNVSDILTFEKQLGLTGQQVVSLQLISADTRQETSKRVNDVQECQRSFTKGLNEHNPDFADIRTRLGKLTEAQARLSAMPVESYEKAYALLTEAQKAKLSFFKAQRQQEIERKAAEAAREREAAQSSPSSMPSSLNSVPPAFGR